jgi:hypothetical protein
MFVDQLSAQLQRLILTGLGIQEAKADWLSLLLLLPLSYIYCCCRLWWNIGEHTCQFMLSEWLDEAGRFVLPMGPLAFGTNFRLLLLLLGANMAIHSPLCTLQPPCINYLAALETLAAELTDGKELPCRATIQHLLRRSLLPPMVLEAISIGENEAAVGATDWRCSIRHTWSIRSITHTQMAHHLAAKPMG